MSATAVDRAETGAELLSTVDATSSVRTVNGVRLHVVAAGDDDDPLVVLLHGFPEFWYGWYRQLEALVDAGYRVLVPDQRGYNLSEKPDGVAAYRTSECARDIVELIATEGRDAARVVGHDWGGLVAWDLALRHPSAVERLAIVNAPHPTVFRRHLLANPEQLRRSWYAACFQLPRLPELACRAGDYRLLERALRETAAPGTFSDADLDRYRRAWAQKGALTGMINWYRASVRAPSPPPRERVDAPALIVWGEADDALTAPLATDSRLQCSNGRLELLPETSHWVQHERPARLTELLLESFADAGSDRH
ncbi:alpha/beta fold hydrolase [Natronolimnohabitans innermongolicus]|uniref:Alpha/beta hydrolase fold protein n=1 Tax=Natronolimnohabitans innermongolicus JCM 12255 TaxID=1227499 RepID=L9XL26_9EURY|nr:alpha/beta hydrolase [Natronolimnohabitans innermongolicus]ELY62277.1 alpha/beta hydrolase fold protein [Natronolimnohabitans innermongolicus JCM 12255]